MTDVSNRHRHVNDAASLPLVDLLARTSSVEDRARLERVFLPSIPRHKQQIAIRRLSSSLPPIHT